MISLESLSTNLVPNVYIKSLTLDTHYEGTVTNKKAGYGMPDSELLEAPSNTTMAPSDSSKASLVLSMKYRKNKKTSSEIIHLLHDELSEYINIYVHRITSQSVYENMLAKSVPKVLTTVHQSEVQTTEKYSLQDYQVTIKDNKLILPEETLEDGTVLQEMIQETSTFFPSDSKFLAYIIVPVIEHPELVKTGDIILGKVSADIIILNKIFQNEGMIFTIAPFPAGANTAALSKFGNPGDIWGGSVHLHNGFFMAGALHTPGVPHPVLDYQVIPVTKFVDNRVRDEIEKNILNVTQTLERMNSLTSRYKSSAINLLDFESYKRTSYLSDLLLSQDQELNVNGFVSIDKENLVKNNCAYPFLFDNIMDMSKFNPAQGAKELKGLLAAATRMQLRVFQGETLLGTYSSADNTFNIANASTVDIKKARGKFLVRQEPISTNMGSAVIEYFSFKHGNANIGSYKYRVEVEYKDPTVEYVKSIAQDIVAAEKAINGIIKRVSIMKSSALSDNIKPGFDPITQRINSSLIDEFISTENYAAYGVNSDGDIDAVLDMASSVKTQIFIYNGSTPGTVSPSMYFPPYMKSLTNVYTATNDSLLVAMKFLRNMRTNIQNTLSIFGAKPLKDKDGSTAANQYGALKNQGDVESSRANKIINASQTGNIIIADHGYDFTGFIKPGIGSGIFSGRNNNAFLNISKKDYKNACEYVLSKYLANEYQTADSGIKEALQAEIMPMHVPNQKVASSAYAYLTMPTSFSPNSIREIQSCVLLPQDVLSSENTFADVENIFNAILKLKYLLLDDSSMFMLNGFGIYPTPTVNAIRQDLDTILGQKFGTFLPKIAGLEEQSTTTTSPPLSLNELQAGFASPVDPPPLPPKVEAKWSKALVEQTGNKNFVLSSLLSKLIISDDLTMQLPMTKADFYPFGPPAQLAANPLWSPEFNAFHSDAGSINARLPLQVAALSTRNPQTDYSNGPFRAKFLYTDSGEKYINNNVINPKYLCYYWFMHQNIAKVEYLSGFEESMDVIYTKNKQNAYAVGPAVLRKKRNVKKEKWKMLSQEVIESLDPAQRLLCRVTQYDYPYYIDQTLAKALKMPLVNNYFVLSNDVRQVGGIN